MIRLLSSALSLVILMPAQARAASVVCEDSTKSVKLVLQFGKNQNSPPTKVTITSDKKSKDIDLKTISRFVRNDNEFYLIFKVPTKVGTHEIELNTRFNKNPRAKPSAAGILTNKTQEERLNVTCLFGPG